MEVLNVLDEPRYDYSITKLENRAYNPYSTNTLRNNDIISIPINNTSAIYLPHKSSLLIEGSFGAFTPPLDEGAVRAPVTLSKNIVPFLFKEIRFSINNQVIDSCNHLGITSSMKNALTLTPDLDAYGTMFSCYTEAPQVTDNVKFSYNVPLKYLLNFFDDYKRILIGARLELTLIRSQNNLDVVNTNTVTNAVINITKLQWIMPHVNLDPLKNLKILRLVEDQKFITCAFRHWDINVSPAQARGAQHTWVVKTTNASQRPSYVIIGIQNNKINNINADPSTFDHTEIRNIKLFINEDQYPYGDLGVDFETNKYALCYEAFAKFKQDYYHNENLGTKYSLETYKDQCPLFVFDTSHYTKELKPASSIDIKVEFTWNDAPNANVTLYCLLIRDSVFRYCPLNDIIEKEF